MLKREWISATDPFTKRWRKEFVPHNLQADIHDVCSNVQLVTLEWSNVLFVKDEELVAEPPVLDHLGNMGLSVILIANSGRVGVICDTS